MKKIRILSIDGGGIRGILPGTILTYLEKKLKEETGDNNSTIGKYFDLIVGTSTGGILSLIYLCPNKNKDYQYSADEALNIYMERGNEIFDVSLWKRLESVGGLLDEKYNETALKKALRDYLDNKKLNQALKPCLITSYDILNRKAHFFNSINARHSKVHDFFLRDVGRATSAAPSYFEPCQIESIYGTSYDLIDGGVFANNPALCAYAEARTTTFSKALNDDEKPNYPSAKDMLIVSLGTGTMQKPYSYEEFKDASKLKWAQPIISIMMSGNSETVDYQLRQIYASLSTMNKQDYYRIQPKLIKADNAMDNAKPENLKALHEDGLSAVERYKDTLDIITTKLIANH